MIDRFGADDLMLDQRLRRFEEPKVRQNLDVQQKFCGPCFFGCVWDRAVASASASASADSLDLEM